MSTSKSIIAIVHTCIATRLPLIPLEDPRIAFGQRCTCINFTAAVLNAARLRCSSALEITVSQCVFLVL